MESLAALSGGGKPSVNFGKVTLTEEEQYKVIIYIAKILGERLNGPE